MDVQDLNQIRGLIREEVTTIVKQEVTSIVKQEVGASEKRLTKKIDKVRSDMKLWFDDLDKKVFYVDQRLTGIEIKLDLPTPAFNPKAKISSVLVNPRSS